MYSWEKASASWKRCRRKARIRAFLHYGMACACCGEDDIRFLTIDHVNGGGTEHRRKMKGYIYVWLRKQGWPKEFQTLCMNCNSARHWNGGVCPHKEPLPAVWKELIEEAKCISV